MKSSKLNHLVGSFLYSIAQIIQGLFFHPYQTMQSLVRERIFFWLTLLPIAVWLIAQSVWAIIIVPVVSLVFSCSATGLVACELIPFFARWLLYFCLLWQLVLLYLFFRFVYAFYGKSK